MTLEELGIINDMPRGWVSGKNQPLWHLKVYNMWRMMWDRVKNPMNHCYSNYKDVIIYDDFRFLSNYLSWVECEPRFNEFKKSCNKICWTIDKDEKSLLEKRYHPDTMSLTTSLHNSKIMQSNKGCKVFAIIGISLDKDSIIILHSQPSVRHLGFDPGTVNKCLKGRYHHKHKGYKWYYLNYKHNKRYRKVVK